MWFTGFSTGYDRGSNKNIWINFLSFIYFIILSKSMFYFINLLKIKKYKWNRFICINNINTVKVNK